MEQITSTASAEDRASVGAVLAALGPVAVVRMVPVAVATGQGTRRRTHVVLWTAAGVDLSEAVDREGHVLALAAVRAMFPGRVWDRAWDYHAASGRLAEVTALRVPPEPDAAPVEVRTLAEALGDDAVGGAA